MLPLSWFFFLGVRYCRSTDGIREVCGLPIQEDRLRRRGVAMQGNYIGQRSTRLFPIAHMTPARELEGCVEGEARGWGLPRFLSVLIRVCRMPKSGGIVHFPSCCLYFRLSRCRGCCCRNISSASISGLL